MGSPWNWVSVLWVKIKLEWWGYQAEKDIEDIFSRLDTLHERDRRADRYRMTAKTALIRIASRRNNIDYSVGEWSRRLQYCRAEWNGGYVELTFH